MIKTREDRTNEAIDFLLNRLKEYGDIVTTKDVSNIINQQQVFPGQIYYILVDENNEPSPYGFDSSGPIAHETYLKDATLKEQFLKAERREGRAHGRLYLAELKIISEV